MANYAEFLFSGESNPIPPSTILEKADRKDLLKMHHKRGGGVTWDIAFYPEYRGKLYRLRAGKKLLALALLRRRMPEGELEVERVESFDKRMKGIGTLLFKHLVQLSKDRGLKGRIYVEADPYAVGFYKKIGMKKIGERGHLTRFIFDSRMARRFSRWATSYLAGRVVSNPVEVEEFEVGNPKFIKRSVPVERKYPFLTEGEEWFYRDVARRRVKGHKIEEVQLIQFFKIKDKIKINLKAEEKKKEAIIVHKLEEMSKAPPERTFVEKVKTLYLYGEGFEAGRLIGKMLLEHEYELPNITKSVRNRWINYYLKFLARSKYGKPFYFEDTSPDFRVGFSKGMRLAMGRIKPEDNPKAYSFYGYNLKEAKGWMKDMKKKGTIHIVRENPIFIINPYTEEDLKEALLKVRNNPITPESFVSDMVSQVSTATFGVGLLATILGTMLVKFITDAKERVETPYMPAPPSWVSQMIAEMKAIEPKISAQELLSRINTLWDQKSREDKVAVYEKFELAKKSLKARNYADALMRAEAAKDD